VWFCNNWDWHDVRVTVPFTSIDLLSGDALAAGSPLVLGAWGTRVLVEHIPTPDARPVKEKGQ
jgi:hypothetical protein